SRRAAVHSRNRASVVRFLRGPSSLGDAIPFRTLLTQRPAGATRLTSPRSQCLIGYAPSTSVQLTLLTSRRNVFSGKSCRSIKERLRYLTARNVAGDNCQTRCRSATEINAWQSLGSKGLLK